jgi:hypothetical protein
MFNYNKNAIYRHARQQSNYCIQGVVIDDYHPVARLRAQDVPRTPQ